MILHASVLVSIDHLWKSLLLDFFRLDVITVELFVLANLNIVDIYVYIYLLSTLLCDANHD